MESDHNDITTAALYLKPSRMRATTWCVQPNKVVAPTSRTRQRPTRHCNPVNRNTGAGCFCELCIRCCTPLDSSTSDYRPPLCLVAFGNDRRGGRKTANRRQLSLARPRLADSVVSRIRERTRRGNQGWLHHSVRVQAKRLRVYRQLGYRPSRSTTGSPAPKYAGNAHSSSQYYSWHTPPSTPKRASSTARYIRTKPLRRWHMAARRNGISLGCRCAHAELSERFLKHLDQSTDHKPILALSLVTK